LPHITCPNHNLAASEGRQFAELLEVDAWPTEDNRHFVRIGRYRQ
jgi:hypothetical protein